MSATVRLSSKLPGEAEINGLDATAAEIIEEPEALRVGVVIYDAQKVTHDVDAAADVPTVRIRKFEPLGLVSEAPAELQTLIAEATEQRTGRKALPLDVVELAEQIGDEE